MLLRMGKPPLPMAVVLASAALGCRSPGPPTLEQAARGPGETYVQGLFGISAFDEELAPSTDSEDLPAIGFAAQHPLRRGELEIGYEVGCLVGWEVEDRIFADALGVATVDDELLWGDLFLGAFAALHAGRARLYVGAGPQLSLAYFERSGDRELDARGAGLGLYARTGIEVRIADDIWLGLGARGLTTELDFDQDIPDVDPSALQGFVTFTAQF